MAKYLIVLFKDKKRKKIINKFLSFERANHFYNELTKKNNDVIFEKQVQSGKKINYEVGLVEVGKNPESRVYLKDEFGRSLTVKLEEENMSLINISPYRIEEELFDFETKKKIETQELIRKYLMGSDIKMISGLNNKVIIQKEEKCNVFTLKSDDETNRFLDSISHYFFKIKKSDCIIVKDSSKAQKKYLYGVLESKGYSKSFLYRKFTTLPQ